MLVRAIYSSHKKFYTLTIITMRPLVKLENRKYGRLTPLWEYKKIGKYYYAKCMCDCWTIKYFLKNSVSRWISTSCWCYARELNVERFKKHWLRKTRIYNTYCNMMKRCYHECCDKYKTYWLRWIKSEWDSFEDFYRDMNDSYEEHVRQFWEKNTTLDRIDNNWNYCKENCRWATVEEQANNKRCTRMVEYKWEKKSLTLISKEYNIKPKTLKWRLNKWWTLEEALNRPIEQHKKE